MDLNNTFEVSADQESTWAFLLDPERVVPCIPGAEFLGLDGDGAWLGQAKVKLGPVSMTYKGKGHILEQDSQAKRVVIHGAGSEMKGKGNVKADVVYQLSELAAGGTRVDITTKLNMTGRAAQFGGRLIGDISEKLTQGFAEQMEYQLSSEALETVSKNAAAAAAQQAKQAISGNSEKLQTLSQAVSQKPGIVNAKDELEHIAKSAEWFDRIEKLINAYVIQAEAAAVRAEAAAMQAGLARKKPTSSDLRGFSLALWAFKRSVGRLFGRT